MTVKFVVDASPSPAGISIKFLPQSWVPLSVMLPLTGTPSVTPFSKTKDNKNTVLTQFHRITVFDINYYVGFLTRLTILAMQIPLKKTCAKLCKTATVMGVGSGRQGGRAPPPGFSNMVQI